MTLWVRCLMNLGFPMLGKRSCAFNVRPVKLGIPEFWGDESRDRQSP